MLELQLTYSLKINTGNKNTARFFMSTKQNVIAHRGASGYLPEHSIEAKAMAYAMGADFIEQDIVMTKDDQLLVLHDLFLDNTSNVASRFPLRAREDGRYYVIDFTLAEIQSLDMCEFFDIDKSGNKTVHFKHRFPLDKGKFKAHTLQQEIELIQGLNKSTGKDIGIYTEIKSPFFHQQHDKDITLAVLTVLKEYGYQQQQDNVYLQCFDHDCLQRIKFQLFSALNIDLKLVQLIADTDWQVTHYEDNGEVKNYNYDWMFEADGMKKIALYADAIGPWFQHLASETKQTPFYKINAMTEQAHEAGLFVHPYTFRREEEHLPNYVKDFEQLLDIFLNKIKIDGLFTDFPDLAVNFLNKNTSD